MIFLTMTVFISYCCAVSASGAGCSWYCRRAPGNLRPGCPPEFSFIENENALWIDPTVTDSDEDKVAYLTFDAGYENGNVRKILDILDEKQVRGSFFILIHLIEKEPELIRQMTDGGHLVCNHTAHHKDMSKITDKKKFAEELTLLESAYRDLTGKQLAYFYRPPEGRFSRENLKLASSLGYTTVFWSFAYADWDNNAQISPEDAKRKILSNVHNGAILLLHPTSAVNAAILGDVIDEMKKEGYRFETLDHIGLPAEN